MDKLLIIDAESLIERAFYAIPNMSNDESLYTNAIYGFTKMFFAIKNEIQPDLIAAVLEGSMKTWRHSECNGFKVTRENAPKAFFMLFFFYFLIITYPIRNKKYTFAVFYNILTTK